MKQLVKNYSFNKATKTVTFTDFSSIRLDRILLITDVTNNTVIYQFNNNALGGTVSGNVLTLALDTNTSAFANSDSLQIYYDAASGDPTYDSPSIGNVGACKLVKSGTVAEEVTCTAASTDYPMASAMVAGTKYLVVYCASACIVAMGAATSATVGVYVGAGQPTVFPVTVTGTAADDKAHVQSATAGAVVRFTRMAD
jgi:hypothetical protein